jgi:hypothetical protein
VLGNYRARKIRMVQSKKIEEEKEKSTMRTITVYKASLQQCMAPMCDKIPESMPTNI